MVTENGLDVAQGGLLQDMPSNAPVKLAIRVYVVRALGLRSQDLNGKSDPYILVKLGSRVVADEANYISQQLDPTFGR
jgi:Ca2+-dependent lipid-binding protein